MIDTNLILNTIDSIVRVRNNAERSKPVLGILGVKPEVTEPKIPDYYDGYGEAVKWLIETRVHAQKGVYPDWLFAKKAPNQTPMEADYNRANYKQNTIQVFKDFVDTYGRAYHENNWSIEYRPDDEQYIRSEQTLQQYLDQEFPVYGSLDNFAFNMLPPLKLMDAMGVVAVLPYDIPIIEKDGEQMIDPDRLIQPYTKFYHVTRVVAYHDDYVIIETDEKSEVEYNGKKVMEGLVYLVFDKEDIYKVYQVGKKIDYRFDISLVFNHDTGMIPVKRVDGISVQIDEVIMQQSPFLYATDVLDEVLIASNLLRGVEAMCAYPYRIMVGDICEFQIKVDGETLTCQEGYHYRHDGMRTVCSECNGTGGKDRVSPLGTLLIRPPKGGQQGDTISPDKAMFYASPGTEILKFMRDEITRHLETAYSILHLKQNDSKVQGGLDKTATEVASDQKALIAGSKLNCMQIFDMYEWCIDVIGKMRYGANYKKPVIKRPVNYDFYLESDYMAQINQAIQSGQPPFVIQSIIYKYLQTLYYPDVQGQMVFNLISHADRLLVMGMDEINIKLSKGLIDKWEVVLHDSAINFVNQLLHENPNFFEQDFQGQVEQLIAKAQEKADSIRGAAPVQPAVTPQSVLDNILGS